MPIMFTAGMKKVLLMESPLCLSENWSRSIASGSGGGMTWLKKMTAQSGFGPRV